LRWAVPRLLAALHGSRALRGSRPSAAHTSRMRGCRNACASAHDGIGRDATAAPCRVRQSRPAATVKACPEAPDANRSDLFGLGFGRACQSGGAGLQERFATHVIATSPFPECGGGGRSAVLAMVTPPNTTTPGLRCGAPLNPLRVRSCGNASCGACAVRAATSRPRSGGSGLCALPRGHDQGRACGMWPRGEPVPLARLEG
jgi:hypothetical protein